MIVWLALIVMAAVNFMNIMLVGIALLLFVDVKFTFMGDFYENNRYLSNISWALILYGFNYFLLVFNGKHEMFLEIYGPKNIKNLGVAYFGFSFLLIILLICSTMVFPDFYGLK